MFFFFFYSRAESIVKMESDFTNCHKFLVKVLNKAVCRGSFPHRKYISKTHTHTHTLFVHNHKSYDFCQIVKLLCTYVFTVLHSSSMTAFFRSVVFKFNILWSSTFTLQTDCTISFARLSKLYEALPKLSIQMHPDCNMWSASDFDEWVIDFADVSCCQIP